MSVHNPLIRMTRPSPVPPPRILRKFLSSRSTSRSQAVSRGINRYGKVRPTAVRPHKQPTHKIAEILKSNSTNKRSRSLPRKRLGYNKPKSSIYRHSS